MRLPICFTVGGVDRSFLIRFRKLGFSTSKNGFHNRFLSMSEIYYVNNSFTLCIISEHRLLQKKKNFYL